MNPRLIFMVEMYNKIIQERNVNGIALSTLARVGKKLYQEEFTSVDVEPWETFKKTLHKVLFNDENIFSSYSSKGAAYIFSKSECRKGGMSYRIPVTFLKESPRKGMQMHIVLKSTKEYVSFESIKATQFLNEFWIPNSLFSYTENGNLIIPVWFYNTNKKPNSEFWYPLSEQDLMNLQNEKKSSKTIDKSFQV